MMLRTDYCLQPLTIGAGDVDADGMMFDAGKLTSLRLSEEATAALGPGLSPANPGQGLRMRPLHRTDFDRGRQRMQLSAGLSPHSKDNILI